MLQEGLFWLLSDKYGIKECNQAGDYVKWCSGG